MKFDSLKWNDFGINVASTFRDLHSRHDFVDVTLACSDGSTLEAHKVILSSVSAYFRDILKVRLQAKIINSNSLVATMEKLTPTGHRIHVKF